MIYIHFVRDCAQKVHKHLKDSRKHYQVDGYDCNIYASQHGRDVSMFCLDSSIRCILNQN